MATSIAPQLNGMLRLLEHLELDTPSLKCDNWACKVEILGGKPMASSSIVNNALQ